MPDDDVQNKPGDGDKVVEDLKEANAKLNSAELGTGKSIMAEIDDQMIKVDRQGNIIK